MWEDRERRAKPSNKADRGCMIFGNLLLLMVKMPKLRNSFQAPSGKAGIRGKAEGITVKNSEISENQSIMEFQRSILLRCHKQEWLRDPLSHRGTLGAGGLCLPASWGTRRHRRAILERSASVASVQWGRPQGNPWKVILAKIPPAWTKRDEESLNESQWETQHSPGSWADRLQALDTFKKRKRELGVETQRADPDLNRATPQASLARVGISREQRVLCHFHLPLLKQERPLQAPFPAPLLHIK